MQWVLLVLGLWITASPWLPESVGVGQMLNSVVVGVLISLLALWSLFGKNK